MQLLVLQIGVNALYNNVSLFPIVTVQAAFFCFSVGSICAPQNWMPAVDSRDFLKTSVMLHIDSFARKEYASLNKRK